MQILHFVFGVRGTIQVLTRVSTDRKDGMDAVDKVIGIERADWVNGGLSNVEQFVKLQILNGTMQLNRI